jgi:hypothetical protein
LRNLLSSIANYLKNISDEELAESWGVKKEEAVATKGSYNLIVLYDVSPLCAADVCVCGGCCVAIWNEQREAYSSHFFFHFGVNTSIAKLAQTERGLSCEEKCDLRIFELSGTRLTAIARHHP